MYEASVGKHSDRPARRVASVTNVNIKGGCKAEIFEKVREGNELTARMRLPRTTK